MFVFIPLVLLSICLFFAVNKRRFEAVLKGIDKLKIHGNIDRLSEQETADVLIAAGMEKDRLWEK